MQTVGAILVVLSIAGSAVFLVAREKARRGTLADEPRDDAPGDWPNLNSFVFHAPETDA